MKSLILYLIRLKFDLHKHECFRFKNQKKDCDYFLNSDGLYFLTWDKKIRESHVSLNFLLSEDCEIEKVGRWV